MKNTLIATSLLLIVLLFSCKKDEDILPDGNIRFIKNDITTTTTWYADTIYVIDYDDFYVDATLTIQAGTLIKFQPSIGAYMGVGASGTIVANGTALKPIIFTSYKDDAYGGDTNNDGAATTPGAADWSHVNINATNSSIFNYCEFYYGGSGSYLYTLTLYGSENCRVTNCTFAHNRGGKFGDFYYGALDASQAETGTVITGNFFYDNILPLSVSTGFNLDASNTFHNPLAASEINTMNGIFVYDIYGIIINLSWSETEVPYVINDDDIWIESSGTLNLANDVVVKFTFNGYLVDEDGAGINQGTGNYFTSFKDDSIKGDTNGDGTATTPVTGDWFGIYDSNAGAYYNWANILYDSQL